MVMVMVMVMDDELIPQSEFWVLGKFWFAKKYHFKLTLTCSLITRVSSIHDNLALPSSSSGQSPIPQELHLWHTPVHLIKLHQIIVNHIKLHYNELIWHFQVPLPCNVQFHKHPIKPHWILRGEDECVTCNISHEGMTFQDEIGTRPLIIWTLSQKEEDWALNNLDTRRAFHCPTPRHVSCCCNTHNYKL